MKPKQSKAIVGDDPRLLALWVADCVEHVLRHFEDDRPNDDRPRQALEAGRAWARRVVKSCVVRRARPWSLPAAAPCRR